jgi:hypothetical protein
VQALSLGATAITRYGFAWRGVAGCKLVGGARRREREALALGVFGVPTFVVGSELLWGHDRLPHLSAFLRGELDTDEELLARILARPPGVERRRAR